LASRLDQRLEDDFVDLPQSHDTDMLAKGVEDANVGYTLAVGQSGKGAPSTLFGQQGGEEIERMDRCQ